MKKDSVKESICKLLIKAGDSGATLAEKDEAFLMAQRLMLKHNIEEDELQGKTSQKTLDDVYHKPVTEYMKLNFWIKRLSAIISKNFRCLDYIGGWNGAYDKKKSRLSRLIMIGIREDVEIAVDIYNAARSSIEDNSKRYIESRTDLVGKPTNIRVAVKNDYIVGYLDGLKSKFEKQVAEYQLVITTHALVQQDYNDMDLKNGTRSQRITVKDAHATTSGFVQGLSFVSGELLK